jgi:nucleotide-binding universal stress UspA family protein
MDSFILVGLDGSAASRRALAWALEEAQRRSCGVEAVTTFSGDSGAGDRPSLAGAVRVQETAREEMVPPGYDRPVSFQVVEGTPAEVLTRLSDRAELVVIGAHSVTGLLHAAMTSVGDLVAGMASCPVVQVPADVHVLPSHDGLETATAKGSSLRTGRRS